jgi:hypothetical protein
MHLSSFNFFFFGLLISDAVLFLLWPVKALYFSFISQFGHSNA